MATTVNPTEVLSNLTVKQIDAIASDLEVEAKGKKADKVKALAESERVVEAVEQAEALLAEKEAAAAEVEEVEEVEETPRTPWEEVYLLPKTLGGLEAITKGVYEVDGLSARRNRDALSAMNISRLNNDQADEAIHRIPKAVRVILEKGIESLPPEHKQALADVPIAETTGSWTITTEDPEYMRKVATAIFALAPALDEADESTARVAVQHALLYSGRLLVHADVLEARRERLAVAKAQPELAGTPDHEDEEEEG